MREISSSSRIILASRPTIRHVDSVWARNLSIPASSRFSARRRFCTCNDSAVSGVDSSCEAMARNSSRASTARLRSVMAASTTSMVSATIPMNVCRNNRLSLRLARRNGPWPVAVPAMAMAETRRTPVEAP